MGKFNKSLIGAAIIGLASLASLPAQALPFLTGTVAVGDISGLITHVPAGQTINHATSVTFADPDFDGDGDVAVNSGTGSFAALLPGAEVNISTRIMDLTALLTKVFALNEVANPSLNGIRFIATTFQEIVTGSTAPNFSILLQGIGVWTDANGIWATSSGAYTLSLTQTSAISDPNAAISFSGTLSTFNCDCIPEPDILALMGLGLGGLAFLRRRRDSKVK